MQAICYVKHVLICSGSFFKLSSWPGQTQPMESSLVEAGQILEGVHVHRPSWAFRSPNQQLPHMGIGYDLQDRAPAPSCRTSVSCDCGSGCVEFRSLKEYTYLLFGSAGIDDSAEQLKQAARTCLRRRSVDSQAELRDDIRERAHYDFNSAGGPHRTSAASRKTRRTGNLGSVRERAYGQTEAAQENCREAEQQGNRDASTLMEVFDGAARMSCWQGVILRTAP